MGHVARLLWHDVSRGERKLEKSANALVAIASALRRNRVVDGSIEQFLEFYDRVAPEPPSHFETVWGDPSAYHWVRTTYDLVATILSGAGLSPSARTYLDAAGITDVRDGLVRHLDDFKVLMLGLASISGERLCFARPHVTSLPLSLPGTRFVLSGPVGDPVEIHGIDRGSLEVTHRGVRRWIEKDGVPEAGCALSLRTCPVAKHGAYELPLKPEAYNRHGMEIARTLLELPVEYQGDNADLVSQALALIERYQPRSYADCRAIIRLIALKPPLAGEGSNMSHSDFPGAFVLSTMRDPYWLADSIIHELHHNRLFHLEEVDLFFADADDNLMLSVGHYSPWREEPRPLHGILHAVYVNVPLWHFWRAVRDDVTGARRALAEDQCVRLPLQLAIGIEQLARHARFSDFGAAIFAELAAEVERIRSEVRALGLRSDMTAMRCSEEGIIEAAAPGPDGRPTVVRDEVLEHARRYDSHGQGRDLGTILAD